MQQGVEYLVEGIKKVNVTKGSFTGERAIVDIKHAEEDTCFAIFLPTRYNRENFLNLLPCEFHFDELTIKYERDIILGYNQPTPKLVFRVKTNQRRNEGMDTYNIFSQFVPPSDYDGFDDDTMPLPSTQVSGSPPPPSQPSQQSAATTIVPTPSSSGVNKRASVDAKKKEKKKQRVIMLSDDEEEELLLSAAAKAADKLMTKK